MTRQCLCLFASLGSVMGFSKDVCDESITMFQVSRVPLQTDPRVFHSGGNSGLVGDTLVVTDHSHQLADSNSEMKTALQEIYDILEDVQLKVSSSVREDAFGGFGPDVCNPGDYPEQGGYDNNGKRKIFWSKKTCMTVSWCIQTYFAGWLPSGGNVNPSAHAIDCGSEATKMQYGRVPEQHEQNRVGCTEWMVPFMEGFRSALGNVGGGYDLYFDAGDEELICENGIGKKHNYGTVLNRASLVRQQTILAKKVKYAEYFVWFDDVEGQGEFCAAEVAAAEQSTATVFPLQFRLFQEKMLESIAIAHGGLEKVKIEKPQTTPVWAQMELQVGDLMGKWFGEFIETKMVVPL